MSIAWIERYKLMWRLSFIYLTDSLLVWGWNHRIIELSWDYLPSALPPAFTCMYFQTTKKHLHIFLMRNVEWYCPLLRFTFPVKGNFPRPGPLQLFGHSSMLWLLHIFLGYFCLSHLLCLIVLALSCVSWDLLLNCCVIQWICEQGSLQVPYLHREIESKLAEGKYTN